MRRAWLGLELLASFVLLLAHLRIYWFLTDDAFISFRYARNLAEGHGLVFNPPLPTGEPVERVEGYSNLLWVLILALFDRIGAPPEQVANVLSLAATIGLWGLIAWEAVYRGGKRDPDRPAWILLLPPFLLAVTRSFAVWSTSGLETRFFEFLVVAGVLRAIHELEDVRSGNHGSWVLSSLLLGLACLTRPDGFVPTASVLCARYVIERNLPASQLRSRFVGLAIPAGLCSLQLAFRLLYYHDWLPNTYYAKVGGQTWWAMGATYLKAFSLEYGTIFWLPLLAASIGRTSASRARSVLLAAAILPACLYVAAVGGDHFEYRSLDLVFPLAYLWLADGIAVLWRGGPLGRSAALALSLATCVTTVAVPALGHIDFPSQHKAGFPGGSPRADLTTDLIVGRRIPLLMRIPVSAAWIRSYNAAIATMTAQAVGIRQEEHARFLPTVTSEGEMLAALVRSGRLRADTRIAIDAVGAIPYYSGLQTLDRLGLTDRIVARGPLRNPRKRNMAHDKGATIAYARERGVEFWAPYQTHFIFTNEDPLLTSYLGKEQGLGIPLVMMPVDERHLFAAFALQDSSARRMRYPSLDRASDFLLEASRQPAAPWWVHANLGAFQAASGQTSEARASLERALDLEPDAAGVRSLLAASRIAEGDHAGALAELEEALRRDPGNYRLRLDLVFGIAGNGRYGEAISHLKAGLDRTPRNISFGIPLARLYLACPDPAFRDASEALRIAEDLRDVTAGRDPAVLLTLAAAYAAAGRTDEAQRTALTGAALARARGDTREAQNMERAAEAFSKSEENPAR